MRVISRSGPVAAAFVAALVAACSNSTALAPAQLENVVDTTTLSALTGTPISTPSGFDGVSGTPARTDLNAAFDFAVDFDAGGVLQLIPAGALGFAADGGILIVDRAFGDILSAPTDGYVPDSILTAAEGTVFVLRSRATSQLCSAGNLPRYGKFQVLSLDPVARTVTLEFLIDLNCGYRGLEPGIPAS